MSETTPTHNNGNVDEGFKRKAVPIGKESPEAKKVRQELKSDDENKMVDGNKKLNSESDSEYEEIPLVRRLLYREEIKAQRRAAAAAAPLEEQSKKEDVDDKNDNEEQDESASSDSRESDSEVEEAEPEKGEKRDEKKDTATKSKAESKKAPERKRRSRSKSPERKRSRSPVAKRRSRSPAVRRRSPARRPSPPRRRSRSPAVRRRSPEIKRRRTDDRIDRPREHRRNAEPRRESERKKDQIDSKNELEEGEVAEVKEAPKPKEPTKRELERMELLRKMEEQEDLEYDDDKETKRNNTAVVKVCPYLDTIDRTVLDFDFEKLCSVSLSTMNVYACMVCGKYYQGRGITTHAYTHSLDTDHRVFLNLQTLKFYCLPDNYEICDPSLEDIKYVLKPSYNKSLISSLDVQSKMSRAYDDSTYFPGIIGLNNIKANDYCNVVLHAFSHVIPLRNYFLQEENYANMKRPPGDTLFELPKRFGELMRKLWNPRAFRKHVSPHEMLQAAVQCSGKKFQITEQSDAADFMTFLLNTLHSALNGTQKTSSSIIYRSFRGRMRQYSRPIPPADCTEEQAQEMLQLPAYQEVMKEFPFLYLSMDLPPPPLYRDAQLENVIPQIPLQVLLNKFNGSTEKEYKTYKDNIMKRFEILRLPEYLIITYKRFTKNQFFMEKNPTIVNFPITNVDLYDCLSEEAKAEHKYTTYDLIANIVHEGTPAEGTYSAQVLHHGSGKWYQMEDLHVQEILPQVIVLAEAYIQVWRLNRKLTRSQRMSEIEPEVLESTPGLILTNPFNIQPLPKVTPAEAE